MQICVSLLAKQLGKPPTSRSSLIRLPFRDCQNLTAAAIGLFFLCQDQA